MVCFTVNVFLEFFYSVLWFSLLFSDRDTWVTIMLFPKKFASNSLAAAFFDLVSSCSAVLSFSGMFGGCLHFEQHGAFCWPTSLFDGRLWSSYRQEIYCMVALFEQSSLSRFICSLELWAFCSFSNQKCRVLSGFKIFFHEAEIWVFWKIPRVIRYQSSYRIWFLSSVSFKWCFLIGWWNISELE